MSVRQTPLVRCRELETGEDTRVFLKLECLQRTGSFKLRGATRVIAAMGAADRKAGVVTASAGNHGAGLALAGRSAGVSVAVVVPTRTPQNKQRRMLDLGAELLVQGGDYDASETIARALAAKRKATFVSAFDDDEVMRGNGGDLGAEIRKQVLAVAQESELSQVLVPVGGGGLIAGMAGELSESGVLVVGCQPSNNCAMYDSLGVGHALCEYQKEHTVAEGCEGAVCERTYAVVARHQLPIVTVSEASIEEAVKFLYQVCGVVAEPSAAVPIAALRSGVATVVPNGITVVVISGGNIDESALDALLEGVAPGERAPNA